MRTVKYVNTSNNAISKFENVENGLTWGEFNEQYLHLSSSDLSGNNFAVIEGSIGLVGPSTLLPDGDIRIASSPSKMKAGEVDSNEIVELRKLRDELNNRINSIILHPEICESLYDLIESLETSVEIAADSVGTQRHCRQLASLRENRASPLHGGAQVQASSYLH